MGLNGAVTWKQITTSVGLVAALSATIGGYYVMGYRVEAAERTANKALEATVEIPVIKRDIDYIKKELDKSGDNQRKALELLQDIQNKVKR